MLASRASISARATADPRLAIAAFSSSTVMEPDPSASISSNRTRRPAISSGDMPPAMTFRASFFSLFMPAKPRRRVRTTLSRGVSRADPFSFIQSCWRTASAVARTRGSWVSILRTHSLAASEMEGQGSDARSRSPLRMESKICCSVSPQKGGTPDRRM